MFELICVIGMVITPIAAIVAIFGGKKNRPRSHSVEGLSSVPSSLIDLGVKPVSPGDEICICFQVKGGYMARVKNRIKEKSEILTAPTLDEIEKLVEQTFKSWAEQEKADRRDTQSPVIIQSPTASQSLVQHVPSYTSVADELTKLAKLKEDGILTDDEFRAQKEKLLNR